MKISMISKLQRVKVNPIFIKVLFFSSFIMLNSGCDDTEPVEQLPNIVLIMGDDIGLTSVVMVARY